MVITKKSLRDTFRQKLGSHSIADRKKRSRLIQKQLLGLKVFQDATCVCFYMALPEEVDTVPMIRKAIRAGKRVVVPLSDLENKELELYEIKNLRSDFQKGVFGIREPLPSKCRKVSPSQIDLVLVPGLVFDRFRHRVGRAGGFYDRFLGKLKHRVLKIGLAFSFQVISKIPSESHDVQLDQVLTD